MYLIDTNIAYYLAGISKAPSFLKEKFLNDDNNKFISSLSLLEIYFKYFKKDKAKYLQILQALEKAQIGIIVFGENLKDYNITIRKLLTKPRSYTERIMKYFQEVYKNLYVVNIMYLGIFIGGLYAGILNLRDESIKLKDFEFKFIRFPHTELKIKEIIQKDIMHYWNNPTKENSLTIFAHIKQLIIASYLFLVKKIDIHNYSGVALEQLFQSYLATTISFSGTLKNLCKKRNYKQKDILNKFKHDLILNSAELDMKMLIKIVEFLFASESFEINDIIDISFFNLINLDKQIAFITSDKFIKDFIKNNKDDEKLINSNAVMNLFFKNK